MSPFRWYGGKGNLARWVIEFLPPQAKVYVEPYAGAASVLWRLPKPYPVEVLNDIDRRIVNLFRVLQDRSRFEELAHKLTWTLYSLEEFRRALDILEHWDDHDEIDRAWAFFVTQNQGFSGRAESEGDWSRVFVSTRDMAKTTNSWRGRLKLLQWWHDRLTRVEIDCRDALEVIQYWDSAETLFYIDPPYVLDTRVDKHVYKHEVTPEHHQRLIETLLGLKGMVVLSGYAHEVYRPLESAGWQRYDKHTACYAAGRVRGSKLRGEGTALACVPRVESLWCSPNNGNLSGRLLG